MSAVLIPRLDFKSELSRTQGLVEEDLQLILAASQEGQPSVLSDAMAHGTLKGGKRLRPFLHMMVARLFQAPETKALRIGSAIELIQCYSLIHDDLPCMDDSALRRGKPSVHAQFDEATAILAGSALHDLAYEVVCDIDIEPTRALRVIYALAKALGGRGILGGQYLDLAAEKAVIPLTLAEITHLQDLKTGALLTVALETAVYAFAPNDACLAALRLYGRNFGLAYQITDDLLDHEGCVDSLGKPIQKDGSKATFVGLMGVDAARQKASLLIDEACAALEAFGSGALILQDTARALLTRVS